MDNIEHKRGKIYYSMGEVAELFDVKPSLIRFWEKKFDILKPHKNKKGNRMFTPEDVDNFRMIYHLVKERGMTLEGARQWMRGETGEELTRNMEIVDRLQRVRALLMEIRQSLKVGDGLSDDYWERDDEPVIYGEEELLPEVVAAESAEPVVSPEVPDDDAPWVEEPAPEPVVVTEEDELAEEESADDESAEDESVEEEDDEFGFGRRDENIPDPFEYEPAEDYAVEPAAAEESAPQPEKIGEESVSQTEKAADEPAPQSEKSIEEPVPQPEKAVEVSAPKPRRKRTTKGAGTLRLDDDAQEQAPKPKFIEQTLF